jgi:hypothetical protein
MQTGTVIMKKHLIIALIFGLAVTAPALAQKKVGTTAVSFLEIAVGARGMAMGEAHVAVANDVTSLYWNPGGVTQIGGSQVSFQYTDWIIDTKLNYAAAIFRVRPNMYVGAHFNSFDSGTMKVTDVLFPDGTGEVFRVQDVSLGLSYAQQLTEFFSMGGNVKFVQSTIWRMKASAMAIDMGFQYQTPFKNMNLGFSISNFGSEMKLQGDNTAIRVDLDPRASGNNDGILGNLGLRSWDLPLIFRIGLGYKIIDTPNQSLLITSDAVYPNNNNPYINSGVEYGFRNSFFLRGGYANAFLTDTEGLGHIRLGFGVKLADRISADYAYSDRGILGGINTLGATVKF